MTATHTRISQTQSARIIRVTKWVSVSLIFIFVVVLGRVLQLQIRPSDQLLKHTSRTESVHQEYAARGDLLDRRGRVLATTRLKKRLFADPSLLEDPYDLAMTLYSNLEGINPIVIDKKLQKRLDTRYVVLIPLMSDDQVAQFRSMKKITGLGLEDVPRRIHPLGDLGAALIGKVGTEQTGLSGMERVLNSSLTGTQGRLRYLRDVSRRAMWVQPAGYAPAMTGESLRLSFDMEIQRIADEELKHAVDHFNAGGGRVIVLDPRSGEILAMTGTLRDRPEVDPIAQDPGSKIDPALGRLRCVSDPFEPGSTFKPFIWAAATELGVVKPSDMLDTHNGAYRTSKGRRIRDSHPYEKLSWEDVLIHSSNIGMAQVAEKMTDSQMRNAIRQFGFGQVSACGLPGETPGIVTPRTRWNHYTQTSVSFGQEIAVTPLQLVRAFSAIAGDGTLPTIHTLAVEVDSLTGQITQPEAWVEHRAIDESIALQTRLILRRVMTEGTGKYLNKKAKYRMFAKTGTPQLPNRKEGGYYQDRYMPNFIAGAPLDNPRLVVFCVIEDPDRSIGHFGGTVAGPVVVNVMNRALEYLGIAPDIDIDNNIKN